MEEPKNSKIEIPSYYCKHDYSDKAGNNVCQDPEHISVISKTPEDVNLDTSPKTSTPSTPLNNSTNPFCQPENLLSPEQLTVFHENGYIVIKNIVDDQFCSNYVQEIWKYITQAPWEEGQGIQNIPDGPFSQVSGKGASKENSAWFRSLKIGKPRETKWFPGNFSAPAIPPLFHLHHSWETRQSPKFYCPFSQILSNESGSNIYKLWASIDRVSVKPPTMGDQDSFYHWDSDPWHWDVDKYVGLQGMLSLSDEATFTLFKGTHTTKFRDMMLDPKNKFLADHSDKPKWISNHDIGKCESMIRIPEDKYHFVEDLKQVVRLNKGDLIIWSNRLLHLASKNNSNYMRYSQYIQFDPAGMCKVKGGEGKVEYHNQNPDLFKNGDREAIINSYRKLKNGPLHEVDDRISCFQRGQKPLVYPSGGDSENSLHPKIWHSQRKYLNTRYAMRFKNTGDLVTRRNAEYLSSDELNKDGKYKDILLDKWVTPIEMIEWDPYQVKDKEGYPLYTRPKLTELGRKLLGLDCWDYWD